MKLWLTNLLFVLKNDNYPVSIETRKLYRVIPDADAEKINQIRIIDESGDDYLYPQEYFVPVKLPHAAEQAIIKAA